MVTVWHSSLLEHDGVEAQQGRLVCLAFVAREDEVLQVTTTGKVLLNSQA